MTRVFVARPSRSRHTIPTFGVPPVNIPIRRRPESEALA
jgi:hypothetical protein